MSTEPMGNSLIENLVSDDPVCPLEGCGVLGFDPPAFANFGWAAFTVKNGIAIHVESGVYRLPEFEAQRLMSIHQFVDDLIEKHNAKAICFERSIGGGMAHIREMLAENTGVIKLVAAWAGVKVDAMHTSTMAKRYTGSGKNVKGDRKKSRIKETTRDFFFPGQTYRSIAPNESGGEGFEHQADAIGFAACHLITNGIPVLGKTMSLLPWPEEKNGGRSR